MIDGSADLETPFLAATAVNSSGGDHRHHCVAKHELSCEDRLRQRQRSSSCRNVDLGGEWLLPMAFFPMLTFQFVILISRSRSDQSVWPVLSSMIVFMITSITYQEILSGAPALSEAQWLLLPGLVLVLLPELSIFLTLIVATVTVGQTNALLWTHQTLLIATIVLASIGAVITVLQIWQVIGDDGEDDDGEDGDSEEEEGDDDVAATSYKAKTAEGFDYALVL
jgi:hypothetical protein